METSRKRDGGLLRRKLMMSFYRAAKPAAKYSSSKAKPSPSASSAAAAAASAASVGFVASRHNYATTPQPKQKVAFAPPPENGRDSSYGKFESLYYGVAADESVDLKAASYISCVQERFRLE